jgi:hypothetical protein
MRTQPSATMTATTTTDRGLAGRTWHKISDVIREMNYATRRLAELNVTVR